KEEEPTPMPTPVPVDNSDDSAFSPVPEITETTESLYLIKGQSFTIEGSDWTTSNKKLVSVSKKGVVKAVKKTGTTPVELSKTVDANKRIVKVYVADPKMTTKKLKLSAGKTDSILIETDFKDKLPIYWYSSATDIAAVDQTGKVTGITKGSATITAQINGKAYNCKVSVTEDTVLTERTLHMSKGEKLTIKKLANVKIKSLSSASSNVVVEKCKITAKESGTAVVDATDKEGKIYKINLIIEDPTITNLTAGKPNKYSVELTAGKSHPAISFKAYEREAVFKSSKPKVAFVNEKGEIIALGKGKAKLTTKINKTTLTINVTVK
nr:Ig-like domain-containing protein [Lachnospiraceae bacterium]